MTGASRVSVLAVPAAALALLAVWLLVLPGRDGARPGGDPAAGGTLVASVRAEPRTFNRFAATDGISHLVSLLSHARLVRINPLTQEAEPWLADAWTREPDGLTYTCWASISWLTAADFVAHHFGEGPIGLS